MRHSASGSACAGAAAMASASNSAQSPSRRIAVRALRLQPHERFELAEQRRPQHDVFLDVGGGAASDAGVHVGPQRVGRYIGAEEFILGVPLVDPFGGQFRVAFGIAPAGLKYDVAAAVAVTFAEAEVESDAGGVAIDDRLTAAALAEFGRHFV